MAEPERTYDDMTKAELLELAAERDIAGRSGVSKDELIAALQGSDPESEVGEAARDDAADPGLLDGVDETEAARVGDEQSSSVDVPYPDGMPGPRPPRSAPVDPNARMSSLGEE